MNEWQGRQQNGDPTVIGLIIVIVVIVLIYMLLTGSTFGTDGLHGTVSHG